MALPSRSGSREEKPGIWISPRMAYEKASEGIEIALDTKKILEAELAALKEILATMRELVELQEERRAKVQARPAPP